MRVFKRGNIYWFELVFDGKRHQRSTKTSNQRTAGQVASAYHTALVKGEVGIVDRKPVPRFEDAMKAFLSWSIIEHSSHPATHERYKYSSLRLLKAFGAGSLDRITVEDVEQFKQKRAGEKGKHTKRKLRPATVNRELACGRAMYNHARKANHELRNPFSDADFLNEENLQDRVLSFEEFRRYLAHATQDLSDVAELIIEQGMRPGEVFELQEPNLWLDEAYLKVLAGKTPAARRRLDLSPRAVEILRRRLGAARELMSRLKLTGLPYLFYCDGDPLRPMVSLQSAHRRALTNSGVVPFRLYDLRHTFATRAAEVVDLVTLAAILGHSRIQMVLRYAHPTQHHQASAMAKLLAHRVDSEKREQARTRAEEGRVEASNLYVVRRRTA